MVDSIQALHTSDWLATCDASLIHKYPLHISRLLQALAGSTYLKKLHGSFYLSVRCTVVWYVVVYWDSRNFRTGAIRPYCNSAVYDNCSTGIVGDAPQTSQARLLYNFDRVKLAAHSFDHFALVLLHDALFPFL